MGRDVESMVRDLTEAAVDMVRREKQAEVRGRRGAQRGGAAPRPAAARRRAPAPSDDEAARGRRLRSGPRARSCASSCAPGTSTSARWRSRCAEKGFPSFQILSSQGVEEMDVNMKDMLPGLFGGRTRKRRAARARGPRRPARRRRSRGWWTPSRWRAWPSSACSPRASSSSTRSTRSRAARAATAPTSRARACSATSCPSWRAPPCPRSTAPVRTDHVLFIAAGAFHVCKPADLIPELQGRFPIRVELEPLTQDDLVRILTEPQNALLGAVPGAARHRRRRRHLHRRGRRARWRASPWR